ncbi:MAG TPA: ABC transporter substrate-binding protein [Streptosporangiaceae bacterium]|nr:ABC transporter substrate-binding protein [Streptosporangiaceae bacterium]
MAKRINAFPRTNSRLRPRLMRRGAAAVGVAACLAVAACSGSGSGNTGGTGASSSGGIVTFAESAGYAPTWILPFYSGAFFTIQEQGWFESLMWPPLYNQGNGQSPTVNYAQSLGNPPVYSDNDTVVTLTIKHWKWSDGQPVTTRDLVFWLNILKANKSQWADYTPKQFPDNVTSIKVVSPYELQMKLNKSYAPAFFTGNELSQITPIPQHVWDRTSAAGKVGNYDETPAGARAVLSYLESQSKDLKTYATNPLWQTVDGPFKLSGYTLSGKVTFVPNKNYSGPAKPKISEFVEVPFTSQDAEYDAVRAGDLSVGYLPPNDYSTISAVEQEGYNVAPWEVYGFNSIFINFNNPTLGPAFKQLYVRQALQYLLDQQLQISKVFSGYAQPDYGMVVNGPSSEEQAEPDAYPYNPAKAKALLVAHGWDVKPGGTTTCARPGTAANECGAGIKAGFPLTINLLTYSGALQQEIAMTSYKTVAATVGIDIKLVNNVNVFAAAPACTASQSDCSWQLADWGGGVYTPPNGYPVEAGYTDCGGNNNHENYCDPAQDVLDSTAAAGGATQADYNNWERFVSEQLPMIWQPNADFEVLAVKKNLSGPIPANTTLSVFPESWYFTK